MRRMKLAAMVVLAALVVVLLLQNHEIIQVRFLFWHRHIWLSLFIPALALAGFVLGYLMALFRRS